MDNTAYNEIRVSRSASEAEGDGQNTRPEVDCI